MRPMVRAALDALGEPTRCAQLRLGAAAGVGDDYAFVEASDVEHAYNTTASWLEHAPHDGTLHLWTDSTKLAQRFARTHTRAVNAPGPIGHVDKTPCKAKYLGAVFNHCFGIGHHQEAFRRTLIEWMLVGRCKDVHWHSGYIRSALFMRAGLVLDLSGLA